MKASFQPAIEGIDPTRMRQHAGSATHLLKALANEKRLLILCLLAERERAVHELNEQLDLSQSALSQHLAVLREEHMVQTRREAQSILYSLAPGPACEVIRTLHAIYCSPASPKQPKHPDQATPAITKEHLP